ncbi:MAG: Pyruvate-flavodoxin oxidoreductase [Calditrichaeota bacterium]|nr:Pyruvate-flavodoxin oxidoreductase [Calditrichota bacterium]
MGEKRYVTIDGNEAAAYVAYRTNEIAAIYPITPSSNMGEWADEWMARDVKNLWGTVTRVVEMQSEGGASASVHGALQTGSLTTTFTASQGLLLMIPSMFKIAGELTPTVFHVSARTVATHALSIFGDHSDINAVRPTGFGLVASAGPQEVMDLALIVQAAALRSRIPFVHFFDGFRTSHEVQKIELLEEDVMREMIPDELVFAQRERALNPDKPVLRGSSQNPDVFFQARETVNRYYDAAPETMQETMDEFAKHTGRHYHLYDYVGAPDAERVVVLMASATQTAEETVEYMAERGEKVGAIKVRLYRPFAGRAFVEALPETVKRIAVLDRTKEPGADGEPLYKDVAHAVDAAYRDGYAPFAERPAVVGGRYGLSSKEFTPAMVKAVLDNLSAEKPKHGFTVGIRDDVTNLSLDYDPEFRVEPDDVFRGKFYGLGADGTVGANKNSIKIIGGETDNFAQGYFVYDSKKSGAVTVSHLRFGPRPIKSIYLVDRPQFVACHQQVFLEKYEMLADAEPGGTFLLNCQWGPDEVWDRLPKPVQRQLIEKEMKFYVIDAYQVAKDTGMGQRINTIMQTCFFAISGILPREEAIAKIKDAVKATYGKKGEQIVQMNFNAIDQTLANLHEVKVPAQLTSSEERRPPVPDYAPEYVRNVLGTIIANRGDELPVSAFAEDGSFPVGTTQYEKRNIALEIPEWDPDICTQCGKCVIICPHASIRGKVFPEELLAGAPETFKSCDYRGSEYGDNQKYSLQVAPEDCTGCELCVEVCPATDRKTGKRALEMIPQPPVREQEAVNWDFFYNKLPDPDRSMTKRNLKGVQFLEPLFEFSGACSGCGETPYVKLLSQLFGDRAIIGNATGCSSIYGGNLPTTPWKANREGRGPAWNNSLFEDAAEFGLGFRLTLDKQAETARDLLLELQEAIGGDLVEQILTADQHEEEEIFRQRERVGELKKRLAEIDDPRSRNLISVADALVKKSVWSVGGDGWAYDIGYGGLDHVLASGRNINILVLDTGVYSNTGGQCSKATPLGAVAKFAAGGKPQARKDLGMMAMSYGNVYVAQISIGANDNQTLKAFLEAEAWDGPSIIIAYSTCIAHGFPMEKGADQMKLASDTGSWIMYRYNPALKTEGKNPLKLDTRKIRTPIAEYMNGETRFRMLHKADPEAAERFAKQAQAEAEANMSYYTQLANLDYSTGGNDAGPDGKADKREKRAKREKRDKKETREQTAS